MINSNNAICREPSPTIRTIKDLIDDNMNFSTGIKAKVIRIGIGLYGNGGEEDSRISSDSSTSMMGDLLELRCRLERIDLMLDEIINALS